LPADLAARGAPDDIPSKTFFLKRLHRSASRNRGSLSVSPRDSSTGPSRTGPCQLRCTTGTPARRRLSTAHWRQFSPPSQMPSCSTPRRMSRCLL
jgi:hypothetical protein